MGLPFALITTPTSQLPNGVEPDMFQRCASEMANIHNMVLRGLNSIYLQAPHVQPPDEAAFLRYSMCLYHLLHVHHTGEEERFFPSIESMSGEKGIMERNVEQHGSFHAGLEKYNAYLTACIAGQSKFDGSELIKIVDSFGQDLAVHLKDEISTLLDLSKYGDRMKDFEKKFEEFAKKDMTQLPISETLSWGFFNHDKDYEGGLWANWPPAPAPLVVAVRWVTYWNHSDWWKFASCDRHGKLRETLYATG